MTQRCDVFVDVVGLVGVRRLVSLVMALQLVLFRLVKCVSRVGWCGRVGLVGRLVGSLVGVGLIDELVR